jgi:hypothetical protein
MVFAVQKIASWKMILVEWHVATEVSPGSLIQDLSTQSFLVTIDDPSSE